MPLCSKRNGLSSPNWIFAVALLLKSTSEAAGSVHTYPWRDAATGEMVTCEKCPPGSFVAKHCTRDEHTACQPCPDLHYTQYWNYLSECRYCNIFCGEEEVETRPCSATQNRQCQCQPGSFLNMDFCLQHSACPPGSGVLQLGTVYQDTQCQKCPTGTFSNSSSSTEPCRPHRKCVEEGLEVHIPGSRHHDTVCTPCRFDDANSTQEVGTDCEQAISDFLMFHISPRQLGRLLRQLGDSASKRQQLNKRAQKKLHALLLHALLARIKDPHLSQDLMDGLLDLLSKAKFNSLKKVIRKKILAVETKCNQERQSQMGAPSQG